MSVYAVRRAGRRGMVFRRAGITAILTYGSYFCSESVFSVFCS